MRYRNLLCRGKSLTVMSAMERTKLKSEENGLKITKYTNTCIFNFTWYNSDLDKEKFIDDIYGHNHSVIYGVKKTECGCGRDLSLGYIFIIRQLKRTGLLPKSYVSMCCYCNILACIGFYIPPEWQDVFIHEVDVKPPGLTLVQISGVIEKTYERFDIQIRIHNIELALKTGRLFNDVGVH